MLDIIHWFPCSLIILEDEEKKDDGVPKEIMFINDTGTNFRKTADNSYYCKEQGCYTYMDESRSSDRKG